MAFFLVGKAMPLFGRRVEHLGQNGQACDEQRGFAGLGAAQCTSCFDNIEGIQFVAKAGEPFIAQVGLAEP